jgi:hypothetical protein
VRRLLAPGGGTRGPTAATSGEPAHHLSAALIDVGGTCLDRRSAPVLERIAVGSAAPSGSSSARGPAAASDGWRGLRMLAARRDQLSKRTDVRMCATGERRWQGGGAVWWHTVGVDGCPRSTP